MTTIKPNSLSAALCAVFVLLFSSALSAASFGPGRSQLIVSGGGEIVIDSPGKQVSLRFIAERDGSLTSVRFASRIGQGWSSGAHSVFTASLHDDAEEIPGALLAVARDTIANDPGARSREILFRNVSVKAGRAYHVVITMPDGGKTKQLGVNYYLFGVRSQPFNSHDMDTLADGGGVLVSNDRGAGWETVANDAVGVMAVKIGEHLQGWAYTGAHDGGRLWHLPGGDRQLLMQNFKFTTVGKGGNGKVQAIRFFLRAQGGLAYTSVPLRVRLLDGVSRKEIGTTDLSVQADDAARFFEVNVPMKDVQLADGKDYVLSIGIASPVGSSPEDGLFMRMFSWGFGNPSLVDAGWQGETYSLIMSPTDDPFAGEAVSRVDMPFVIEYTPLR